jgi:hypothetical protein
MHAIANARSSILIHARIIDKRSAIIPPNKGGQRGVFNHTGDVFTKYLSAHRHSVIYCVSQHLVRGEFVFWLINQQVFKAVRLGTSQHSSIKGFIFNI